MELSKGCIAVVTGGGTGMGRELVRQLAERVCMWRRVTLLRTPEETRSLASADAPIGTLVSTFVCDVSDEGQVRAFRDAVSKDHSTEHINLLFNNAGIGGGAASSQTTVKSGSGRSGSTGVAFTTAPGYSCRC